MNFNLKSAEQSFFRALNTVVEPAVRSGLLSPRLTPSTLILLQSKGFKSGKTRSTPLVANRFGRFLIVSTVRGEKSFWVRNLAADTDISYFLGGKERAAQAVVLRPGSAEVAGTNLPRPLARLAQLMAKLTERGWAFAILVPAASA